MSQFHSYGELKDVEVNEVHAMPDQIHMLVKISPKMSMSRFMRYLKGRSAIIIHEGHANLKYNYRSRSFWAHKYYVSTVGLNQRPFKKLKQK